MLDLGPRPTLTRVHEYVAGTAITRSGRPNNQLVAEAQHRMAEAEFTGTELVAFFELPLTHDFAVAEVGLGARRRHGGQHEKKR